MKYALVVNPNRCVGCDRCIEACEEKHGGFHPGTFYTNVIKLTHPIHNIKFVPVLCMHCEDPPCAKICPSSAISVTSFGAVVIDQEKCIGCSFCSLACPFNRIHYDATAKKAFKCDLCYDRVEKGEKPACVVACPFKARIFGEYSEMLNIARKEAERIGGGILLYPGETHVIYILTPEELKTLQDEKILTIYREYPNWSRLEQDLANYSRWAAIPLIVGLTLYLVRWRKKRIEEILRGGERE